jgi:hypothetical protein
MVDIGWLLGGEHYSVNALLVSTFFGISRQCACFSLTQKAVGFTNKSFVHLSLPLSLLMIYLLISACPLLRKVPRVVVIHGESGQSLQARLLFCNFDFPECLSCFKDCLFFGFLILLDFFMLIVVVVVVLVFVLRIFLLFLKFPNFCRIVSPVIGYFINHHYS